MSAADGLCLRWKVLKPGRHELLCNVFFLISRSYSMLKQRSLAVPSMLFHFVPPSPPQRRWMSTEPSCQMEPLSPLSPLSSLDSNWITVQVTLTDLSITFCSRKHKMMEWYYKKAAVPFRWFSFTLPVQSGGDREEAHHPVRRQRQPQPQQWVQTGRADVVLHNRCKVG